MENKIDQILANDAVIFKLAIAKHFASKLPRKIPSSINKRLTMEANLDSFLFFASSVVDVIKREINDAFEIFDKENVFYIHGIRKHLADFGKEKKVKKIIADYFTTPLKKNAKFDTSCSSLWKLQILRNQVMHGRLVDFKKTPYLTLTYTIRNYKKNTLPVRFEENIQNPQKYFGEILDSLIDFVIKIRKTI